MTQDGGSVVARPALRHVGEPEEPDSNTVAPDLAAELEAVYARLLVIEREADSKRREIEAEADRRIATVARERDEARVAQAAAEEGARLQAEEARTSAQLAREAQERAETAETIIQRLRTLPGLQGWLLRWLASDILPD